jgi:hypothetical protein
MQAMSTFQQVYSIMPGILMPNALLSVLFNQQILGEMLAATARKFDLKRQSTPRRQTGFQRVGRVKP